VQPGIVSRFVIVVGRPCASGGRMVFLRRGGQENVLGLAHSDHDLVVFLEAVGIATLLRFWMIRSAYGGREPPLIVGMWHELSCEGPCQEPISRPRTLAPCRQAGGVRLDVVLVRGVAAGEGCAKGTGRRSCIIKSFRRMSCRSGQVPRPSG
jgi:hypothetical protein